MTIAKKLKSEVHESIDSTPVKVARYFKVGKGDYAEHDKFLGVRMPTLRKIAKVQSEQVSFEDILVLLQSEYNEERSLALILLVDQYKAAKSNEDAKRAIYEFYVANMQYINNWNLVDISAHLIVGSYLLEQGSNDVLDQWAAFENLWTRRVAMVSTWAFIKADRYDVCIRVARLLLQDQHDLIHKATGWMLREMGKRHQATLIAFLDEHAQEMPRVMLSYSVEKLSEVQRKKYQNKRM